MQCKSPLKARILIVANLLQPFDVLAVESFGDGDMGHRRRAFRTVPVLLAWCRPDDIARMDLLNRAAPALNPSAAGGDDQRLAEWMRMPSRARGGLEGHVRTAHA